MAATKLIAPRSESQTTTGHPVRLVNAYSVALASKSVQYRGVLGSPGTNLCDSKHLAWVLDRSSSIPVKQVRGPSLFTECLDRGREYGVTHLLAGATDSTLKKLTGEITRRFPGAIIVGHIPWPFGELSPSDRDELHERVIEADPDIVWLALGTPKQDFEAALLAAEVEAHVVAVGAAFDFVASTVREAPQLFQKMGLEWLYRLAQEPRRLWRRYLFGNVVFVRLASKHLWTAWRSR